MLSNGHTTVGTACVMVDGRHTNPVYLHIHNLDNTDTVYVGGAAVTTSNGYPIDKGQNMVFTLAPLDELWAVSTKAGHVIAWIRQPL